MLTPALGAVSLAGTPHVNHVNPFASGLLRVRQKPCKLETPKPYFAAQCVETSRSRPGAVVLGFVFRLGADPSKFQRRKHEGSTQYLYTAACPPIIGYYWERAASKGLRIMAGIRLCKMVQGSGLGLKTFACWLPQAFIQIFMP